MYTSIEKVPSYAPQLPDIARAEKNAIGKVRRMMTAMLGREFMELPARHKVYALYFCLSLMLLCTWDEQRLWLNVLNVLNLVNAARLANKASKELSARDRMLP